MPGRLTVYSHRNAINYAYHNINVMKMIKIRNVKGSGEKKFKLSDNVVYKECN